MDKGAEILCNNCRVNNRGKCLITGMKAPMTGTCAYFENKGDISRPKFVTLLELIEGQQRDINDIKVGLLGNELTNGLKQEVDKNKAFRKRAEKVSYVASGVILICGWLFKGTILEAVLKIF